MTLATLIRNCPDLTPRGRMDVAIGLADHVARHGATQTVYFGGFSYLTFVVEEVFGRNKYDIILEK